MYICVQIATLKLRQPNLGFLAVVYINLQLQ